MIAASPSVADPVEALGRQFETDTSETFGCVSTSILGSTFDEPSLEWKTISRGQYFIGSGPIHLVAPGGDELITRLEQKYYVLPGTRRPYAEVPLVMVVPEALVEAPTSFESLTQDQTLADRNRGSRR